MVDKLKIDRKLILWHILFWIVFMAFFTFLEAGYQSEFKEAFLLEASYFPLRLALAYSNYFLLLPMLLFRKRIRRYVLLSFLSILVATFLQRLTGYYLINPLLFPGWDEGNIFETFRIIQTGMILTSPMIFLIGLTIVLRWVDSEKKVERLARDKVEAELKYLKNQVNPHFFFNTLNNLYGLAQEKSDKTPDMILKLSELMSYMLYETNKELIALTKEIDYIKNYISLEKHRFADRFHCDFDLAGRLKGVQIPPMLILPFIENAFKHGVNQETHGALVSIKIEVVENELKLKVVNSVSSMTSTTTGGLGIHNVERRLELLYPGGHEYKVIANEREYQVYLLIELDKLNRMPHET